jgi:hypothetical protein
MSDSIMKALARGDDPDSIVNRAVLLAAVQRAITCGISGNVLDIRTAVYYRVVAPSGQSGSNVVTGAVWDEISENTRYMCNARNIALEVIDGRML